jgi:hypothetical protein
MKRIILIAAAVGSLLLVGLSSAGAAPAIHFTEDVTGSAILCGDTTYHAVFGELAFTLHEGQSASGNQNFTVTIVPRNVVLQDEAGNLYSLRGTEWAGSTGNANTGGFQSTFTGKFQIVSQGGGTVDSVNAVFHVSPNENLFEFDFGTCVAP